MYAALIVADASDVVQPRASAGVSLSVSLGLDVSVSRRLFCLSAVYTHVRHTNRLLHSANTLTRLQMNAHVAQCVYRDVRINTPTALLFLYSSWFQLRIDLILL